MKPIFELAGMVLTAAAWTSISIVCCFLGIRGYWNRSPAIEAHGWIGDVMYWVIIGPFVLMAASTSILLLLAVWSMVVKARFYVLLQGKGWGLFADMLRLPYYFAAGTFLFFLIVIPTAQILQALSEALPPG
ncbi:MAG: hypothetical protein ABS75_10935 [Pelagibacterium sp. SCN 63-23]|nr:MAG: hypothetical protein ABS75_10935 [Pelagibacterium sp. SCN 63-23]